MNIRLVSECVILYGSVIFGFSGGTNGPQTNELSDLLITQKMDLLSKMKIDFSDVLYIFWGVYVIRWFK